MPLEPGEKLGPYQIVALLGRGGMGEVYRAHDPRLARDVALKIVPEDLAGDSARMARFEREAKLLAALNHPNLGAIYGIENVGGRPFLVLEFIEGESLAVRIERGALPIGDALDINRQVALAIETAHENGIVHRDLKPGNVMVRGDGTVKVVDFGLATSGASGSAAASSSSQSPTLTQLGGGVLGTAGYMSPEQARGRIVDRRTDIWAFGCVLYECLSGKRAFDGDTVSDVIAKILEREPDYSRLPPGTPASIRRLIARCLEKDPSRRLRDIGDARLEIEEVLASRTSSGRIDPAAVPPGAARPRSLQANRIVAGLVGAAVAALAIRVLGGPPPRNAATGGVVRLSAVAPSELQVGRIVLTPDGKNILMFGRPRVEPGQPAPSTNAYVRRLDERDVRLIPGTENVGTFQLTADNTALMFRSPASAGGNRLWRVPLDGSSPAVAVCDWNQRWEGMMVLESGEVIAFADQSTRLVRVSAQGVASEPVPITGVPPRTRLTFCSRLPGDRGVLINLVSYGPRGWYYGVGLLDPKSAHVKVLVDDGGNAVYWKGGQILFARGDALLAAPFDLGRLEVTGTPVGLMSGLRTDFMFLPGDFQFASNGTLAMAPGGKTREQTRLGSVSGGVFTPWNDEQRAYNSGLVFSRDGKRMAITIVNPRGLDEIFVGSVDSRRLDRAIAADADCSWPVLSADGASLIYNRSGRDSLDGAYIHSLLAPARDRRVFVADSSGNVRPWSWSPDGRWLLLQRTAAGHNEILKLEVAPPGAPPATPQPLFDHPVESGQPMFSPDGHWVAYQSLENGVSHVEICSFSSEGVAGSPISVAGGGTFFPRWGDRGARLYYGTDINKVMGVSVTWGSTPSFSKPFEVCDARSLGLNGWAFAPGDRLMGTRTGELGADANARLDLVLHWDQELKAKLAEAGKK